MPQWLLNLNISWDFDDLGKVMRTRGRITVDVPSAGDRRTAEICLTLITSKPRLTSPSELSFAGVVNGRCRITAFRSSLPYLLFSLLPIHIFYSI
jgi:hypothetical protein